MSKLRRMRQLHQEGDLDSRFEFYDTMKELFDQAGGNYDAFVPDFDLDLIPENHPSEYFEFPLYA